MRKFTIWLTCLLLFVGGMANAQTKVITGKVTSADDGLAIPGVTILVPGTTVGTTTDFDGNYSLSVDQNTTTLRFSFIGMVPQEIQLNGRSVINVVLENSATALEEVIVTGYTSHRKSDITGSTVQINADEIADMPVVSIDQALKGRVAGVKVNTSSGTPGSTSQIRIRGRSSITAGNEPLYVIDGVPMTTGNTSSTSSGSSLSTLAALNSNNIESITVLKDASATSAYGARGANGVIVITTKSGKSGKADINFSATYGFSNDAIAGPTPLTGAERQMLFNEALINTYGDAYDFHDQAGAKQFDIDYIGSDYPAWNAAGSPETDWATLITNKNAPMMEYNLSASGGSSDINYYIAGGYLKQEATVIGSDYERFTGSLNLEVQLTPSLKFATKNNGSFSYQDGLLEASAYFSSPRAVKFFMPSIDQAYNADGSLNLNLSLPNPLYIAKENIDESKFTRILSNNTITWETPIENLTFTSRMNVDYQVYRFKNYWNPIEGDGVGSTGYGYNSAQNTSNFVIQNMFNYKLNLDGKHKFDFSIVQEFQKNKQFFLSADADNFTDVGLTNLSSAGNPTSAFSSFTDWSVASYLGLISYAFDDSRYVANFSIRREGSSRFHPDNRWGNFWAFGAGWNLDRTEFIKNMDQVNVLKLRASYGVSGNANIGLNQFQSLLSYNGSYAGEGASYPGTFGNNSLSWETNYTFDIGVDFGLFNNRLSGSIGYYRRETKDMLLNVNLSMTTGFNSQTQNIGRMENKGFELELNYDVIRSQDFNFTLSGNIATNANQVLELAKDLNGEEINITTTIRRVETGHPVFGWYMPTWAGVNPETGNEEWYVNIDEGTEVTTNFNAADQTWQGGSALPTLTAGLNLHFDYKGFFLDAYGYYAGGHKVYEGWHRYTQGTDVYSTLYYQGLNTLLDRWQKPGDVTRFGKFEYTGRPWQRHSKFLYDGDFIRLRDLTIGYDFNQSTLDAIGLGGLRVFVRGTNLLTWVKDDNLKYDPETDAGGDLGLETPAIKSFIFGINVKF